MQAMKSRVRIVRWALAALLLSGGVLPGLLAAVEAAAAASGNRPVAGKASAPVRDLRILTSFYPMHIMALNVLAGVPGGTAEMVAPPMAGCLHDYSLTTEAMRKLERADLLIANGLGMESYLPLAARRFPRLKIVELSRGITPIRNEAGPNPHVWVSIDKARLQVANLTEFLTQYDPGRRDAYQANGGAYARKLEALGRQMHRRLDPFKGTSIVTFHEAFPYFAQEFALRIAAVVAREPGTAPSPRELADTIAVIRKQKVKALFGEPQYPDAAAEVIARETGLKIYLLDPVVTGPMTPDAYLTAMARNLSVLEEALK